MMVQRNRYGYTEKLMDGVCVNCDNPFTVVYWLYWMNPWWRCGICFKAVCKVKKKNE